MRALLSLENFDGTGGTETYALTVAQQLDRLGHEAWIYTPNAGLMAEFARGRGVRVVGRAQLPRDCDVVFAQDAATCHELADNYRQAARVFVAHSRDHALQDLPPLSDVCDAVVVFNERVRSWIVARSVHPPLTRLRQPIDTWRFAVPRPARARPSRVLVSSNYVSGARAELLERACRECTLEVAWIGGTSGQTSSPEVALADADIVIGQGRTVLEGMAAGCAAYVYGTVSGDGWVTPESYPAFEADGFAGLSNGDVIDGRRLVADLRQWDPGMGETNRDLVFAHHAARVHAIELVGLVRGLDGAAGRAARPPREPSRADELARLVRLEWQMYGRAVGAGHEVERLRTQIERYREAAEHAEARASELERIAKEAQRQLAALLATRRYRVGQAIAAPLDRVRRNGANSS
jgi:hypothetical protein